MKKSIVPVLLLFVLIGSGCWDRIELNDLGIVTGIAIDKGEEKRYKLTLEHVNASQFSKQESGSAAPVVTVALEGDTIGELANKMNVGTSRRLTFSHTRVMYIDEEVAKEGVYPFLDFVERNREFRNDFNIVISRDHKASDFTKINDPVEKIPSLKIQKQIKAFVEEWGGDPMVRLAEFVDAMTSKGRAPVTAALSLKGKPSKGVSIDNNKYIESATLTLIDSMAVFTEGKLIGFLSLDDARYYLWTQNKLDNTTISFPCSKSEDSKEKQYITAEIYNTKAKMEVEYKNNNPLLKVDIRAEAIIEEIQCAEDLSKYEIIKRIEKQANDYLKENLKQTIQKVQEEYGVDIFGFGETLYRKNYKKFKEVENVWHEQFAQGEVEVSVQTNIRSTGTRNKSLLHRVSKES